mmetsp:Transcript_28856/g.92240  ORF Transcript_28856/g.92240 Transcript_28856/m.92240 type:complete len:124 (-) Transcript_28856:447-818(-)
MGGNAQDVFGYMEDQPLPDDTCGPFKSVNFHSCDKKCTECQVTDSRFFWDHHCTQVENYASYGSLDRGLITGEDAMMKEIYAGGPIECMLLDSVPSFEDYDGEGVICEKTNATGHNHDIEILG